MVKVGAWIMIGAILSTVITYPLGFGVASGVAFVGGMVFAWSGGLLLFAQWVARQWRSMRNGS